MPLHDELAELLSLPENGKGAPSLAMLEARLTDGYAEALSLEAERSRMERRLGELARAARRPGSAGELESLSRQLSDAEGEIARLRGLLETLQERARTLRGSR